MLEGVWAKHYTMQCFGPHIFISFLNQYCNEAMDATVNTSTRMRAVWFWRSLLTLFLPVERLPLSSLCPLRVLLIADNEANLTTLFCSCREIFSASGWAGASRLKGYACRQASWWVVTRSQFSCIPTRKKWDDNFTGAGRIIYSWFYHQSLIE